MLLGQIEGRIMCLYTGVSDILLLLMSVEKNQPFTNVKTA